MPTKYFDNSKISSYKECPRKYFLRYVLNWTLEGTSQSPALVFGSSWHSGLDKLWGAPKYHSTQELIDGAMEGFEATWKESYENLPNLMDQDDLGARTPGVAHEMYFNYVVSREKMIKECEVLAIERPIAVPIPNFEGLWYIGKLDKVVNYNGIHTLEHKSTTAYAIQGNFRYDYVESWNVSPQVKGYEVCGKVYYPKMQDVWMDLALVHKKVHDAFKFVPIMHSAILLEEWTWDMVAWVAEIKREEELYGIRGQLSGGGFRKNEDSCYGKFGQCAFLSICQTCADPSQLDSIPQGYVEEKWEPFDTSILETITQVATENGVQL